MSLETLLLQNVWITEGGVRLYYSGCTLSFLLPMFSTPTMLLILKVWNGEVVQFSLCTHILKLSLLVHCTRSFVKDVIVTECVDRRRCSAISLYPHSNIVITYNPRQRP